MPTITTIKPISFLVHRRRIGYWLLVLFLFVYVAFCGIVFLQWVNPSLTGHSDLRIAADSGTYMYMAHVLREGRRVPWVYEALTAFPNTLWMPVFLAFVIPSTIGIAFLNLAVLLVSLDLFRRVSQINLGLFVALLLLNPTTTISILSVNKEIIDLFVVALFCFALVRKNRWLLFAALTIAFLNRYEVCVALIAVLYARSKLNPFQSRRMTSLVLLALALTITLPSLAGHTLARRFVNAENGNVVRILDLLEMHYLYIVAVIPKIVENMFGELLDIRTWGSLSATDLANSYVLLLNNLASFAVLVFLYLKGEFKLRNDWVYFASIAAVLMATALVNQPRYFYYCFALLCFQAAQIPTAPRHSLLALMYGKRDALHA